MRIFKGLEAIIDQHAYNDVVKVTSKASSQTIGSTQLNSVTGLL